MVFNMFKEIPPGRKIPEEINVIIEIPKGSRNKYEIDENTGAFKLNRVLYSPFIYSTEYGIVPQTKWDDGDALDVLVIIEQPTFAGCIIECRPIAVLEMNDSGVSDVKILAVPVNDPHAANIKDIKDVDKALLKEIELFFKHYKELQGIKTEVIGWRNSKAAKKAIKRAVKLYNERRE
ncbi:MAG: inorganic diphosphatase [Candidatus Diapherotrites archaeon]|nr:inorganic diphosphatase [Candidatus Diapherotrites archaeon]